MNDVGKSPGDDGSRAPQSQKATVERLTKAREIVDLAWRDLPPTHRALLEAIGADKFDVVDQPLGSTVNALLISAGLSVAALDEAEFDDSVGIWIPSLRVMLVNASHESLDGLDARSFEAAIARIAWHEWGHALRARAITT